MNKTVNTKIHITRLKRGGVFVVAWILISLVLGILGVSLSNLAAGNLSSLTGFVLIYFAIILYLLGWLVEWVTKRFY